ncbi:MAG: Arabinose efflux permease [Saliniramus fredricksonii]|uniref:Arabinose efflux permease n=1 Tax=Saliniramus fredricksonii TaxID=1653334 RepID=A0A0P8A0Y2_9HYPH|nr:MFS transporter [Saliniramus fredricksonii]KPQ11048.1 MAG: Arabinose efflux permease [Saliniramus fredricksonii]SCC78017.1 Predicted arabinose efflux permease, MFS family [Saliniramus fredricksonii]
MTMPGETPNPETRMPGALLLALLVSGISLAACYGATFLLAEHLRDQGRDPALAGIAVTTGTVFTIAVALVAGRLAARIGTLRCLALAGLVMALAMLAFALTGRVAGSHLVGGALLGIAWSLFYILAPLPIIARVAAGQRIRDLTYLSGAQMAGLGLAAPLGGSVAAQGLPLAFVYIGFALLASGAAMLLLAIGARRTDGRASPAHAGQGPDDGSILDLARVGAVLATTARVPIVLIGLASCTFAGLATFQSLYAAERGLAFGQFFLVFTLVTVALRFGLAAHLTRLPAERLAVFLLALVVVALALFWLDRGSVPVYLLASALFAAGYGLSYSTLNALAVNRAEAGGAAPAVASQVFTITYFLGLFGFPAIGGLLISMGGTALLLPVLAALATLALALALGMLRMPGVARKSV